MTRHQRTHAGSGPPRQTTRRSDRAIGIWLTVGVALLCLSTAGGSMTTTDAVLAFDVTKNIVEHGSIATTDERLHYAAYRGRDGRFYSPFGIAQSVWNIPFYVAGRTAARAAGPGLAQGDTLPKAAVALATVPAVALLAWACFALLLALGAGARKACVTAVLLVFATSLWPYSGFGFNQPLAGMFVWSAVLFAVTGRTDPGRLLAAGALAGLAILTRHEMALAAAVIGGWVLARHAHHRSRALGTYLAGLAPFAAVWCGLNWWRFGHPLESGYLRDATPGFGSSLVTGAWGLLLSPYASLFLYCPIVALTVPALRAMWRHDRDAALLLGAMFVACFALYASLGNWMGGRSYGPRYLVPLLPALILPLAFWSPGPTGRVLAATIAVISVLIQIPGVLVDYSKVREARAAAGDTVAQDLRWSGMPLLLNAQAVRERVPEAWRHVSGAAAPPPVPRDVPLASALSWGLNLWWLHLFYLGVLGRVGAVMVGSALACGGIAAALRAVTLARDQGIGG